MTTYLVPVKLVLEVDCESVDDIEAMLDHLVDIGTIPMPGYVEHVGIYEMPEWSDPEETEPSQWSRLNEEFRLVEP